MQGKKSGQLLVDWTFLFIAKIGLKSDGVFQQQLLGDTQAGASDRTTIATHFDAVDGIEIGRKHTHVIVIEEIDQQAQLEVFEQGPG